MTLYRGSKANPRREDITIVNMYVPNIRTQCIRQILTDTKGKIDNYSSNTLLIRLMKK